MREIEDRLIKEMKKALKHDDVPVGALILREGKILCSACNTRDSKNNILGHAEINVIKKASKMLKTWNLSDCTLYVTLEPCDMCREIIKQSRIKKTYYFLGNNKKVNYKADFELISSEIGQISLKNMQIFFENKR